jgi:alpha-tubulin suppressor-like RCC1 family protein
MKAWGSFIPGALTSATGIAAISAGENHCVLLSNEGRATPYGYWQSRDYYAFNYSLAQSIASGANHAMAIWYGTVLCWGHNSYGQCLGNDASGNPIFDYPCGGGCSGRNAVDFPQIPLVKGTTRMSGGMAQVAGGYYHSMARTQGGKVYCWGSNSSGQCDVPAQLDGVVSIGAGVRCSLALKNDGSVVAWGDVVEGLAPAGLGRVAKLGVSGGYSGTLALRFPVCSDDLDETGSIDFGDIALAMLDFGPCEACRSDQDQNGTVDFGDVALLLLGFGPCP